jgi:hypothetical protein
MCRPSPAAPACAPPSSSPRGPGIVPPWSARSPRQAHTCPNVPQTGRQRPGPQRDPGISPRNNRSRCPSRNRAKPRKTRRRAAPPKSCVAVTKPPFLFLVQKAQLGESRACAAGRRVLPGGPAWASGAGSRRSGPQAITADVGGGGAVGSERAPVGSQRPTVRWLALAPWAGLPPLAVSHLSGRQSHGQLAHVKQVGSGRAVQQLLRLSNQCANRDTLGTLYNARMINRLK